MSTKERLLEAAKRLFTEHGFDGVSVRDICKEAGANVAAVNYHFGDKLELYMAVVEQGMAAMRAGEARPFIVTEGTAEERLALYIEGFLMRALNPGAMSWIQRLIRHEIGSQTAAAPVLIEKAVRPRLDYLRGLVSELLGEDATEEVVTRCVVSIESQCLYQTRSPLHATVLGPAPHTPEGIRELARHVHTFSLAGIRAVAAPRRARARS